ncbi:uncharacterized protein LOC131427454 [Malaya genurostris]|uniref:uncharacterized protein LOC131427454 n=1 Tax=Malaya genurostris TaxID=325434 RepID=UPI0026F3C91F|nr:uncharacterized protein LOC131427454 [Malaya genurostris]
MDELEKKVKNFLINFNASGVEINCLPSVSRHQELQRDYLRYRGIQKYKLILMLLVFALGKHHFSHLFTNEDCILEMPNQLQKVFRPPESCQFCKDIRNVPRIANVDPDEFERKYAYSGGPVIVTDATVNWTATEYFDYWFFKEIYQTYGRRKGAAKCQFFPYQTNFHNIFEAFSLDEARVRYEIGTEPWYFGWSNCDPVILKKLRQHYGRPYFLPKSSENNAVDWVFMGGTGLGAHMHVDNVRLPSWQSQLKGAKEWILAPPPECYYSCNFMSVVVQTGDTIVLDTNKWYHKTNVLSGEISITVGAEYD